jgi:flagellar hook-length control protein FliK
MISKVASPTADSLGITAPATSDAADSGLFDVLLTLQSQANADTATALTAPQSVPLEGGEVLAGLLEDATEEPADEVVEPADDALWFLGALLPAPKVSAPAVAAESTMPARFQNDAPPAGATLPVAAQAAAPADPAQTLALGAAATDAGDPQTRTPNTPAAATPAIDTTTWNSLSGTAEFFSQAAKHGTVERIESAPVTTHVRDPRWAEDLGNRLVTMVRTGETSASLQLTPVDLGPLEVNVSIRDNQASVHFGAANAETRALLEASMPRLREMLASQGFHLMDSSVSHGFARQTRHEAAGTPRVDALGEAPMPVTQAIHINGLLDLYA